MYITWLGYSCFKIQDKTTPDGITLVTDPFDKSLGLKIPNFEADIATISHEHGGHNNSDALRGKPFVINSAGEYDIKDILVEGVESSHDNKGGSKYGKNIIYRIEIDDISIVHLGDLGQTLDSKQLEKIGQVDILIVPVGGGKTLDAKNAVEVVSQIEPRIVIPMHYKTRDLKMDIEGVDKFIKELGLEPTKEDKLKINKKDLPSEDMELIVLNLQ
jgi:L-ascorbate metabolism protein UlaG (beta-lactamase superfamily)